VGLLLGGTTTVVVFCGAGGLLLLIQPDSAASMTSEAKTIFMVLPLLGASYKVEPEITLRTWKALASHPAAAPVVSLILL
jgi:hypothetical protein